MTYSPRMVAVIFVTRTQPPHQTPDHPRYSCPTSHPPHLHLHSRKPSHRLICASIFASPQTYRLRHPEHLCLTPHTRSPRWQLSSRLPSPIRGRSADDLLSLTTVRSTTRERPTTQASSTNHPSAPAHIALDAQQKPTSLHAYYPLRQVPPLENTLH